MKLQDKVLMTMITSDNYKERFRGEYFQLMIRMRGLFDMLVKYKDGTLDFTPSCSYDLLFNQFGIMREYAEILEDRAEIEGIDLSEEK